MKNSLVVTLVQPGGAVFPEQCEVRFDWAGLLESRWKPWVKR